MVGSVQRKGKSGWRLVLHINGKHRYGPTRSEKDRADADQEYVSKVKNPARRLLILKKEAAAQIDDAHAALDANQARVKRAAAFKQTEKRNKNAKKAKFSCGLKRSEREKRKKRSQHVPKASEIVMAE
eukprot:8882633-Karenia_brevis.AAC.1